MAVFYTYLIGIIVCYAVAALINDNSSEDSLKLPVVLIPFSWVGVASVLVSMLVILFSDLFRNITFYPTFKKHKK